MQTNERMLNTRISRTACFGWILVSHCLARAMILILSTTKRCPSSLRFMLFYYYIGVLDAFLSLFVRFLSSTLIMDLLNDPADLNHPSNTQNGLFVEAIRYPKHTNRDQRRNVQILY